MSWSAEFSTPIAMPDGRQLRTVEDARNFLNTLRGYETNALEWQTAIAAVLLVGKTGGSTEIARAAIIEAVHRNADLGNRDHPPLGEERLEGFETTRRAADGSGRK